LNVFGGLSASGTWKLFIADLSPGGSSVLNSWQLILVPVPEPSAFALVMLGLVAVSVLVRQHQK
jgi:hypothetical protein